MKITKAFEIESAHFLPLVPKTHKCSRLHGHTYRIELAFRGTMADGMVVDFFDVEAAFAPIREELDHHLLNEVPGLENPTAELIAVWIFDRVKAAVPQICSAKVFETPTCWAEYEGV